ncbi:putative Ig domain-containing protein [Wenzhouxiangella marina]|uniref:Uncharacterized protein n=1 Tax=Wenzhouxiangella marina TaxID=1579979 RepID=A0A0K0XZJ1_9GAMM|nr:putative Ig domain-containing protein [Wenzhouxiangella marina]AKS43041.1 hypothetical protein WM2015_2683 [Wenzhouxiangella marina]MBB6087276.1 hypothetical protein [Wenzhouxiangella marina]
MSMRIIGLQLLLLAVSLCVGPAMAAPGSTGHDLAASSRDGQIDGAECVLSTGRWGGGVPQDGERFTGGGEDLLLIGAGAELVIFDISTPTLPVELGRAALDHPAIFIAISEDGQMAAASDAFDNATLVDISNRGAPLRRGTFAWPGLQQPYGMEFRGSHLFVAVRTIGLAVLDISDPDTPTWVANSDGAVSNFVFDVALRGNHAYLGQDNDGIQIVDISNPATPTVVAERTASTGAGQLTLDGNRLYVARGANGFEILDLSNPTAPALLGSIGLSGFLYEVVAMPGDRVAVANNVDGTVLFDISTPATPVELGNYGFSPFRLVPVGNSVFTIHGSSVSPIVRLVDFQDPGTPVETAQIVFNDRSRAVSVGPDHVLVANSDFGVVMLDTTNPVAPILVDTLDIGFEARRIGHLGGYGIASTSYSGEIAIIDPIPGAPALVNTLDNSFQSNDLVGVGSLLYVASGQFGGLRIHDLSNPMSPTLVGSLVPAGQTVWQIAVAGTTAYSGYSNDTDLLVIDVSNPALPVTIGSPHALPSGTVDIAASGSHVFVGTQLDGVRILEHDGLGGLTEVADIGVSPAVVTGVSIDGDRLYISAGVFSGLLIYDISDPASPVFVEQYNTAGDGEGVDALGGVIAMAEGESGVTTLGCDPAANNQPPVAVGTIGDQNDNEGTQIFPLSTNASFNDPDGQALSYSASGLPPGLEITPGSGVVEGTLDFESSGSYPVVITATDPFGLFATQSFTWNIIETNAPPQVESEIPDQLNDEEDVVSLDVSSHFSDIDGDTLRFEIGNLPEGLSMDGTSGVISGTISTNAGRTEPYIVLILAFDPDDAVTSQTIEWTVNDTVVVPLIFNDRFEAGSGSD